MELLKFMRDWRFVASLKPRAQATGSSDAPIFVSEHWVESVDASRFLVPSSRLSPALALRACLVAMLCWFSALAPAQNVVVKGETVYTMAGAPIVDGVVVITDGKIAAIGVAAETPIPGGYKELSAKYVVPGLIDARTSAGLTGIFNTHHDQDQLEESEPLQPQLRAVDAFNAREELIDWIRSFGITTIHTGHAPGEAISGQTMIVKLGGTTVDDNVLNDCATIAATISPMAHKSDGKSPGTRGKLAALLRQELVRAREYVRMAKAQSTTSPRRAT